jgi:DNA polymerase I-like protein with 3'-5' exonuclease and polymerase domains
MGRRRYLANINCLDQSARSKAERQAVNSVIQGSASDLIKYAMLLLEKSFRLRSHNAIPRIVMQIHDELVYEIPINDFDRHSESGNIDLIFSHETSMKLIDDIRELMTNAVAQDLRLNIPLVANMSIGVSLGEMKPWNDTFLSSGGFGTEGARSID